eukprot:CAMPEP_0171687800 /NCGR_PEP_ID=MMETSP0991-20121206/3548_1 /TAXON_ID=483369 /ORGANISM="non described non described, Strain CCMP2098" /LENGTH=120 /DNA_ID=CAMNT_0012275685 /DNA_START=38 /DNA_END=400 /DNA_ORIENTATION=+
MQVVHCSEAGDGVLDGGAAVARLLPPALVVRLPLHHGWVSPARPHCALYLTRPRLVGGSPEPLHPVLGRHVLPHQQPELVGVAVPPPRLEFNVLAHQVEPHGLVRFQVEPQGLVRGGRVA